MYVGFTLALASLGMGGWIVLKTLVWGEDVRGYPTLIVTVLCLGGMQLFFIGVLGEYLGRIFSETKQRPLYIVESFRESRVCRDDHCGGTAYGDTEYTRHVGVGALPIN
jgi:hypothetical protein